MKKIVLINISGEDRPGITSMLTGILAAHGINVLDIGQAVIHSHLALGLLVEIPEERETSAALKELLFHAHEAGLQLRYTPVSDGSYREWAATAAASSIVPGTKTDQNWPPMPPARSRGKSVQVVATGADRSRTSRSYAACTRASQGRSLWPSTSGWSRRSRATRSVNVVGTRTDNHTRLE